MKGEVVLYVWRGGHAASRVWTTLVLPRCSCRECMIWLWFNEMDTNVCVFVESNHRFVSCKAFTTTAAFQASTVTSEYTVDYSFATYVKVDASFFCFNSFLRMFESCILVQVRRARVYAEHNLLFNSAVLWMLSWKKGWRCKKPTVI